MIHIDLILNPVQETCDLYLTGRFKRPGLRRYPCTLLTFLLPAFLLPALLLLALLLPAFLLPALLLIT